LLNFRFATHKRHILAQNRVDVRGGILALGDSLNLPRPKKDSHLISVQPPRSTRSSSLVTLARPPTSSSLRIIDRSFRYAEPCLWISKASGGKKLWCLIRLITVTHFYL